MEQDKERECNRWLREEEILDGPPTEEQMEMMKKLRIEVRAWCLPKLTKRFAAWLIEEELKRRK